MKHNSIIAREGFPFIIISLVLTVLAAFFGILGWQSFWPRLRFLSSVFSAIRKDIFKTRINWSSVRLMAKSSE